MKYVAVASALLLTACGVAGAPERPVASDPPGLSVSGDARVGLRVDGL
ncbi:hypothetical protein [Paracoccus jeotgali]|nr:hypothetical protein [Paracoccus jeotgali]